MKLIELFDHNFKEILLSQIVSVIGGLIAGVILAAYTDKLLLLPGMLIIFPGFLEMRGNISGSFASRLSSGLFLKVIDPNKTKTHLIKQNLLASFFLAIVVALALGILGLLFSWLILDSFSYQLLFIPVIAAVIANAIEIPLTMWMTFYWFKKKHDPNNIMGPFVTSSGDVISVIALLVAMVIV
jgi:mgtE-like transporter